jgi:hypothetical protein
MAELRRFRFHNRSTWNKCWVAFHVEHSATKFWNNAFDMKHKIAIALQTTAREQPIEISRPQEKL